MRKLLTILFTLLLMVGLPGSSKAAQIQSNEPVVHAVLLFSSGCPYCTQVLTSVLPPIQEKYNSQLNILLIDLESTQDIDNLYKIGAYLGLSKEQVAVPFLLIDRSTLIGIDNINNQLPGLVEKYLSEGGLGYPDIPTLNEMLPKGIEFTSYEPSLHPAIQAATTQNTTGMALAWGIMAIMVVALIAVIGMILRAFQGNPLREIKGWLNIAMPILAVFGLGVSIYLTYVEITHSRALCGPVGDCNAVQSSSYAKLFGILPIGLLGALGYIAILITWLWRRLRSYSLSKIAGPAMFGMALFGTLFSIYLTYLELFVIHAVCIWCLMSAVVITILMLLCLPALTQWLAISDEEE